MPEETPNQIEAATEAKWSGAIKGLLGGIISNWKEIAIIVGLIGTLAGHFKESSDTQEVWKHSGNWVSNINNLQIAVSNLQSNLQSQTKQSPTNQ